jgi:formylglycine-generating enzyme required for sulfatase activity/tRNA A-37 threonylcarbamoyl transferase component Bud32
MSLTIACPGCKKSYNVPDDSVGTRATCKSCGHKFTVAVAADETRGGKSSHASGGRQPPGGTLVERQGTGRFNEPSPEPPKRLGRFEIRERLGGGGFGTVYRGYDPVLKRDVALKVPHASALASEESRARLCREPEAAAQLRHPNIVPIYDAGFDGDQFFIASAFIEGSTLDAAIHRGEIDPRRAATVARKLADALDCAHEQGIVHRDVKPANVMLDRRGEPQLMDFGLAQWTQASERFTQDGMILGTPAYMSPEQAGGPAREVGPASDQYSLGATLYEMLAGEPPFSGPALAIVYQVREKEPPPPSSIRPEVPPALEAICLRAMAKQPAARFCSCHQLAEALDAWLKQAERTAPAAPIALAREASGGRQPPGEAVELARAGVSPRRVNEPPHAGSASFVSRLRFSIKWTRRHVLAAATAAFVLLCGVLLLIPTPKGTIRIEVNDPLALVQVDGDVVRVEQLGEPLELKVGEHELIVRRGDLTIETRQFTVKRGDNEALNVTLEPIAIVVTPPPIDADQPVNPPPDDTPAAGATESVPDDIQPSDEPTAEAPALETASPSGAAPPTAVAHVDDGTEIENSIGMRLRRIEPGEFLMGAPAGEAGADASEKQHRVRITKPFYIGVFEVTQAEYRRIIGNDLSQFKAGRSNVPPGTDTSRFPVETCSYDDANGFCAQLSALAAESAAGRVYRLPTEAEWEYACRAGTTTPFSFGATISSELHANFNGEFVYNGSSAGPNLGRTTNVGSYAPNAWGLYDMHGNVWEWCADNHSATYYDSSPVDDPPGPSSSPNRVFRGGAFDSPPARLRSAHRGCNGPPARWNHNGFRVAMTLTPEAEAALSAARVEAAAAAEEESTAPLENESGFVSIFNGQNLQGWTVDSGKQSSWQVRDGQLIMAAPRFDKDRFGYLLSLKDYRDFILRFQFQATDGGDSGVALRAVANGAQPSLQLQVHVGDDHATSMKGFPTGGLFYVTDPPNAFQQPDRTAALKPAGQWNDMEIYLRGNVLRVTVNGRQVYSTSLLVFANRPNAFPALKRAKGRIGFQAHTALVKYRNIRIKELAEEDESTAAPSADEVGFVSIFNGQNLQGWTVDSGKQSSWQVQDTELVMSAPRSDDSRFGYILSAKDYTDFILRFEFQATDNGDSGVALRAVPGDADPSRQLQINLGNDNAESMKWYPTGGLFYTRSRPETMQQPDRRASLKPAGEWNEMEIYLRGNALRVTVNGQQVFGISLAVLANRPDAFPALKRAKGRIGFQAHTASVKFRNIRIKELAD